MQGHRPQLKKRQEKDMGLVGLVTLFSVFTRSPSIRHFGRTMQSDALWAFALHAYTPKDEETPRSDVSCQKNQTLDGFE